jgi:hypothetical protein
LGISVAKLNLVYYSWSSRVHFRITVVWQSVQGTEPGYERQKGIGRENRTQSRKRDQLLFWCYRCTGLLCIHPTTDWPVTVLRWHVASIIDWYTNYIWGTPWMSFTRWFVEPCWEPLPYNRWDSYIIDILFI